MHSVVVLIYLRVFFTISSSSSFLTTLTPTFRTFALREVVTILVLFRLLFSLRSLDELLRVILDVNWILRYGHLFFGNVHRLALFGLGIIGTTATGTTAAGIRRRVAVAIFIVVIEEEVVVVVACAIFCTSCDGSTTFILIAERRRRGQVGLD